MTLFEQFERDGYVVLEDFFAPGTMADAQAKLEAHFGVSPEMTLPENFRDAACDVVPWNPTEAGEAPFVALQEDEQLETATREVLGGDFEITASLCMFSPPHSQGQAWHQDCPKAAPGWFNLNRLVYTHDIGDNGGEIVLVPGSHRRGIIPVGDPHGDMEGQVTLAPQIGTLVFLHGHTFHRVRPVKARPRISTNFRVVPQGTPHDVTSTGVYRNMTYNFPKQEATPR